ncbi:MAG: signal peptide peptidase SppA, partial [Longimicrobiales bacterium]|nr:signal peptide peptidase SppA [Longimicrobiales bacterium]
MRKSAYVGMIFLFFFLLAAAGAFFLVVMDIGGSAVDMPARGYLEVPLSGAVSEVAAPDSLGSLLLGARPLALHDLWTNLRKAKVDGRIQAVLLRLGLLQCDWAKANEMREAILDFRRSGKKVYAVIEEAPDFDMEYFVATACDRIILHPLGWLGINGIGGYVPFLKGALDKLGVRAEFEHVEVFKTAANMFTEKGFTTAHREEMESLYSDLFAQYVATAAKARGKSEAEFRALIDRGFFQGEKAKAAGLVDDCLYEDQVQDLLRQDGRAPARVRFADYTKVKPSSVGLETGRTVALIYAVGTIMTGESLPQVMGGSTVARWIRTARNDGSVKAIVLRVDSPGGSSVGSDVIWREVALARKVKPVVVSMSDVAGSGGYWIAMAATRIVAQPQTLTGSIGVLAGKFSIDGLLGKLGVTSEKLAFGEKADIFSPFRPFTPDERKVLKEEILWTYEQFLAKAAEGRGLTRDEVDAVGKGRVWTGRQAKDLKLVDEL